MSKSNEAEMITPPNLLQIKVGGPISMGDLHLIEKAEDALKDMRGDFGAWLEEEVQKLEKLAVLARKEGLASPTGELLFVCAHDLRGLGATYEFPIITRLAKSMTKLIDEEDKREQASVNLVMAHVGAMRAALSQNIRDVDDPVAAELANELEKQSEAFAEPWSDD